MSEMALSEDWAAADVALAMPTAAPNIKAANVTRDGFLRGIGGFSPRLEGSEFPCFLSDMWFSQSRQELNLGLYTIMPGHPSILREITERDVITGSLEAGLP